MAAASGSATKEVYGPAAPSLEAAEKRVNDYSKSYDKEATGKSNLQKAMDASRKVFNEGYGDDMFKNNGKSRAAIADVKAQLKSGKITQAQATVASTKILNNFERERIRVTGAQANNAQIGKGVQSAGRVVTVAGSAIGGTLVAGPVGGIAAATVAGSAYDAATKLDQGSSRFSHQFDVSNSVGGVTARLIKGEKVNGGDWARGAAGSGMDAISGAFAGGGMLSAKAAQTALLTAAKQTGVKVSLTAMAKAAALSNVRTSVVQTAATTGYKTLTIMGDRSLTAKERSQLVRRNIKDTVKRAPFDIASGAGMAFVGVKVQLPHKVADGVLQYGMDVVSNGAQKSLENFIAKKDARLSTEDMAAVLTQSAGGTLNNMVQRVPHGPQLQRGGGGPSALHPSNSTLKGQTSTGQTLKLQPVDPSASSSSSIKPLPKVIRIATGESKAATNADGSVQVPKTAVKADAKTELAAGRLSTADEARLNEARRLERNPFMPGDAPFDAKGRLREGFSFKDFAEGTSTMRVSQDPPGETPHTPASTAAKIDSAESSVNTRLAELQSTFTSGEINQKTLSVKLLTLAKKELKSIGDVDSFTAALVSGTPEMIAASKDADLKRGLNRLKLDFAKAPQQAADAQAREKAIELRAAEEAANLERKRVVKAVTADLGNSASLPDFMGKVTQHFPWLARETDWRGSKQAFDLLFGATGSETIRDRIEELSEDFSKSASTADLAETLVGRLSDPSDRYSSNILNSLKKVAEKDNSWQDVKSRLVSRGANVPNDDVLKMAIPVAVPSWGDDPVITHQVARPPGVFEDLNPRVAEILRPASLPADRDVITAQSDDRKAILELIKNPKAALAQAYPDLTPLEIESIYYEPGRKYPSGAQTIEGVPHAFPKTEGTRNPPVIERKTRETVNGKKETYFVFHASRTTGKSVTRSGVVEPHVLFRGDSRSPEEIVNSSWQDGKGPGGLFARGRNLDVADHVFNMSDTSGYISATDKLLVAIKDYSQGALGWPDAGNVGYVYILKNPGSLSKDFVLPGRGAADHEHLIIGGVKAENIMGYITVQSLDKGVIEYSSIRPLPAKSRGVKRTSE